MNLKQVFQPIIKRSATPVTGGSGFLGMFGAVTKNGMPVNEKTALHLSAFFNGIEIISSDYAKLPKAVYQKKDGDRKKVDAHTVSRLLSVAPNECMTAYNYDKMQIATAILKGNHYAEIIRHNFTGQPIALEEIDQDKTPVTVIKSNKKLWYKFDGRTVAADNMIHVPGFSFNGITGIGIINFAAKSLGVNLSSQEFSEDYYGTKGIGTAVVTTPSSMLPDAKKRYGDALGSTLDRSGNWKVAIVDEGGSFNHIKITPQEAQFLMTAKFGIEEVARWLNIPVTKLKSLENTNNSITEQLEIQHVQDSIVPWAKKFEQEYQRKLLTTKEIESGFYIRANHLALLRADSKSRAEYLSKMVNSGIYTPNEAREAEDKNRLPDADELRVPVNTMTESQFQAKLEVSKKNTKTND